MAQLVLYRKGAKVMDYVWPLFVAVAAFFSMPSWPLLVLILVVMFFCLLLTSRTYAVTAEEDHLLLDNFLQKKTIAVDDIIRIQQMPFHLSQGAMIFRITYKKNIAVRSVRVRISYREEAQRYWQKIKRYVATKSFQLQPQGV